MTDRHTIDNATSIYDPPAARSDLLSAKAVRLLNHAAERVRSQPQKRFRS